MSCADPSPVRTQLRYAKRANLKQANFKFYHHLFSRTGTFILQSIGLCDPAHGRVSSSGVSSDHSP